MSCDIKPRLTKEQHDILEEHYQKQQKPNTKTKKGFAETLGVPLDKVNNWFQNRRAKSKQDAKKQAGSFNLFAQPPHSSAPSSNFSDSATTSPAYADADYFSMMQQCTSDDGQPNGLPTTSSMSQYNGHSNALHISSAANNNAHYGNEAMGRHLQADIFDSEANRRTLTQEQFDAFAQNGGMMRSGHFEHLHEGFSGDSDVLNQVFPEMQGDFKSQHAFVYPNTVSAPMSSNDSSIPSTISEQSMFSATSVLPDQASVSTVSSEWGDSRSSSVSMPQHPDNGHPQQVQATPHQPNTSTSQWQPGQSVPVDPNQLHQQFREASAQRQRSLQQQVPHHEQPLAWPADEAYMRRDSQNGAMLAQQMNSFALQTPQPPQSPTFKTPAAPGQNTASIAVRRQRPKPQPLGLAAMRSQSYNGVSQPGSPGQQQAQFTAPAPQLRRIRSSNVVNGVAQGRVMKSVPGSAQRSPLNWTFADAATSSPKIVRHASSSSMGNLAPPTPMSPNEAAAAARQEQSRAQFQCWQSITAHFSRQESISESDAEHNVQLMPSQSGPQQPTTSPPHTPIYQHQPQQFAQARMMNSFASENTPPQSAPAVQTSFPANAFVVHQQQQQQQQPPPVSQPQPQPMQMYVQQQQQHHAQQQHFMSTSVAEQGFQVPAHYGQPQHFVIQAPEGGSQMPLHFASGGVPVVNADGNITLAYPPQMQQMQYVQQSPPQVQGHQPPPHMHTPPQAGQQFSFVTSSGASSTVDLSSQLQKPAQPTPDFYVHEYTPPRDLKQNSCPRKALTDNGPKNYTFANQGPEHFEKGKKGDKSASASESPSSATSG